MENHYKKSSPAIILIAPIAFFFICNISAFGFYEPFGLYSDDYQSLDEGVAYNFYPSGYSDGFWYGKSVRHPHGPHEMLSGEWAAAIFYLTLWRRK